MIKLGCMEASFIWSSFSRASAGCWARIRLGTMYEYLKVVVVVVVIVVIVVVVALIAVSVVVVVTSALQEMVVCVRSLFGPLERAHTYVSQSGIIPLSVIRLIIDSASRHRNVRENAATKTLYTTRSLFSA